MGKFTGAIRILEDEKLKKPQQHLQCLNHMAELPIKNLIQKLDGQSSGPNCWSDGVLGKQIQDLDKEQGPFVQFRRITCPELRNIDPDSYKDKKDIRYLLAFGKGIDMGRVLAYLKSKRAVPLHPARS